MREEIINHLEKLEIERGIRILLAVESGSRAWGFPSPDSDYDVRFFYVDKKEKYLSVKNHKDRIDYFHGELLDLNGWDIKKALGLLMKSNASIFEWTQSPIVYKEIAGFKTELLGLCEQYFQGGHTLNHYKGIAKNSFASFDGSSMKLKKFFYVFRPLLAAKWIVERGTIPPMAMDALFDVLKEDAVEKSVKALIEIKKDAGEAYVFEPENLLLDFVNKSLEDISNAKIIAPEPPSVEALDLFFRKTIGY